MRFPLIGGALLVLAACHEPAVEAARASAHAVCTRETPSGILVPPLRGRVVDDANILSPEAEARLDTASAALEQQTTDQLVIVTVPDLHGRDIADFGLATGRVWGIGQTGKDNGVLLIVAPNEHKVRIEVGNGLEPILTDERAAQIIADDLLPDFKSSQFDAGTEKGAQAIAAVLTAAADTPRVGGCRR